MLLMHACLLVSCVCLSAVVAQHSLLNLHLPHTPIIMPQYDEEDLAFLAKKKEVGVVLSN